MRARRRSPLSVVGQKEVTLQSRQIDYLLKQSSRIRGIRLEIHRETGLIVVVPRKYDQRRVDDVLTQKADWILKHLPDGSPVQMPLFTKEIDHGERIRFMGRTLEVSISAGGRRSVAAELTGSKLHITVPAGTGNRAGILENWYRRTAAEVFTKKADHFQTVMGIKYNRLVIRGQRKRWASASPLGNLSMNWKLLLAPEPIIDYVIMHELAHLKHMDHSKRFWDYLSRYCPRWREYRKWLTVHEDELKQAATFMK
jgi:predicted metal-dependent hydrolase